MDSGTFWCVIVPILAIVAILFVSNRQRQQRSDAIFAARMRYDKALEALRADPSSSTKRAAALEAGRSYSSLTREGKGVTVFDEVALKNDLDAATAGAVSVAAPPAPVSSPAAAAPSVADRLRQLDDLKGQGLITEDEYQARRAKILEGV